MSIFTSFDELNTLAKDIGVMSPLLHVLVAMATDDTQGNRLT